MEIVSDTEDKTEVVFKKPTFIGRRPTKAKPVFGSPESSGKPEDKIEDTSGRNESTTAPKASERIPASEKEKPNEAREKEKAKPKSSVMAKIPYKEPSWGGIPPADYYLEELKSGVIVRQIPLSSRSFHCFGRLEGCHVSMLHPTISRYHAVLQFKSTFSEDDESRGFYLFDLGSTHGTFLNKNRLKPETYARVQVGHMIKLGCSTRMFLLQGPEEDQEEESELTITEMKEQRRLQKLEEENQRAEEERKKEEAGIDWGMGEDADEETDLTENPFAITTNEELYIDDPKKTLRGWFEREGEELEYDVEEKGFGHFICRVTLPIDTSAAGQQHIAEASVKGKKKEAVIQCALEACRILDRLGLLRQSTHESKQKKRRNWEEDDYYDSDEDSFFDRTGELEAKRQRRKEQMGKVEETIDTYETLLEKHKNIVAELEKAELKMAAMTSITQHGAEGHDSNEDALDSFMSNLTDQNFDKLERKKCRIEIEKLKLEEKRLRRLVNFTKPPTLPEVKQPDLPAPSIASNSDKSDVSSKQTVSRSRPEKTFVSKSPEMGSSKGNEEFPTPKISKLEEASNIHSLGKNSEEIEKPLFVPQQSKKKPANDMQTKPKKVRVAEAAEEYSTAVWQPPAGQTGDGRTSLNDKYGY